MSTGEKERKVIHRAVRVLDEIETRIHELREELEANGMTSPGRGRKGQVPRPMHDADHERHEHRANGRSGSGPTTNESRATTSTVPPRPLTTPRPMSNGAMTEHEPKAQSRAKTHEADDDREAHGQGRVKHPETDKRLKGQQRTTGDELHGRRQACPG